MLFSTTCEQTLTADECIMDEYIRIQEQLGRFLYSSCDKEHGNAQVLQTGVTMAKL